jgi:drug/metabolite transporter (DMT)-like permease
MFAEGRPLMENSSLKMGFGEWMLLLFLALLWGSSFLLMKVAVQELPVFTVVFGRIGIAALVMTIYVYLQGLSMPTSLKDWGQLFLLGFLRAGLPISLFVWAGTQIDSSISGILNSTTPLFTVLVAHFLTQDEKMTVGKFVAVLTGMIGVVFLIGPNALQGLGSNVLGQIAVLGATLSYGFAGVYGRRFKHMPVSVSTAGLLIGSTIMILPIALILDQPWLLRPSLVATGAVAALAIFNTGIAFMVWLTLVLKVGANNTAQVTFIIPVIALLLGFIILQETIGWNALVGLGFILLGLAISQNEIDFRKWAEKVQLQKN